MVESEAWKCSPQTAATSYANIHLLNLWKNRCACKYGCKATNISRVKYAIYNDNYKMLNTAFPQLNWPSMWTDLMLKSEKCVHDIKVSMVKWLKPADQWLKVNTGGSALMNPGRLGEPLEKNKAKW